MLAGLLGLLLGQAAGGLPETPAEQPVEDVDEEGVSWYLVPAISYDTDDRLGGGARFEWAKGAPKYQPYKTRYILHAFAAQSGFHHHRFRFDRTALGARERSRFTLRVAWRQWLNDGYWGIGNGTLRELDYAGTYDSEDPRLKRYRYSLFQPFVHATFRQDLGQDSPWQVFGALNPKWSIIRTYEDSLLLEQAPYGMAGGPALQLMGGVLHDTRQPEIASRGGALLELSGRITPPLGGDFESSGFWGVLASARMFWTPGTQTRATLASRFMVEWLGGEVPFYEMVHWGGAIPTVGFGGQETLRGARFGRWRAPGKAIANIEGRIDLFTVAVGERPLTMELAPLFDLGAVFGAADQATAEAPANPIHPAAGVGTRLRFDETFVGRIDTAWGIDPVELADGSVDDRLNFGMYVAFDHPF